jgi:hypothetical protein
VGPLLAEAVLPAIRQKYPDWNYADLARSNILDVGAELDGTKKVPQADVAK